jgi:hypothetical protein
MPAATLPQPGSWRVTDYLATSGEALPYAVSNTQAAAAEPSTAVP